MRRTLRRLALRWGTPLLGVAIAAGALTVGTSPAGAADPGTNGKIVWVGSEGDTDHGIWVMNADGSGKTRITYAPGFDGLPVFSADGKHLMWSGKRTADNTTQVFVARFTPPVKK